MSVHRRALGAAAARCCHCAPRARLQREAGQSGHDPGLIFFLTGRSRAKHEGHASLRGPHVPFPPSQVRRVSGKTLPKLYLALRCCCRNEPVATADGCDLQVQAGVFRVAALIDENHIGFLLREDADKNIVLGVTLAKMTAQTALTFVY